MPVYRKLGDGDAMAGFEKTHKMSYQELDKMVHDMGHAHPVSCVDCHDPDTMGLRVTRPGFIKGIQALAKSEAPTPHIPSVERWRKTEHKESYDPNKLASRTEMRSFVCGQCHVEYYCSTKMPLEFPWSKGLKAEQDRDALERNEISRRRQFYDYQHKETGAKVLKAQHPEFELWSQGIHARVRRVVRRLPHALSAQRRDESLRPLGPQPAAEHQSCLPDVPSLPGRGNQVPRRGDPGAQLRPAAARGKAR